MTPDAFAQRLRDGRPAVFARIQNDLVLFDPRTILDDEEEVLVDAIAAALAI